MKRLSKPVLALLMTTVLASCGPTIPRADTETAPTALQAAATSTPLPTATDTAPPSPTASATATSAPTPTTTPTPTLTPLPSPTATPTPTSTATIEASPTLDATRSAELYELGLAVYRDQFCGTCHTLDAAGTGGIFGPPHDVMSTLARERVLDPTYTGSAKTAAEYIRESILDPNAYIVPGYATTSHHMPAYTHLSEEEILALIQFLRQQK